MDATAKVLEKAAEILAERGVHRGNYVNHETGREVCAVTSEYFELVE